MKATKIFDRGNTKCDIGLGNTTYATIKKNNGVQASRGHVDAVGGIVQKDRHHQNGGNRDRHFARGREQIQLCAIPVAEIERWISSGSMWSRSTKLSRASTLYTFALRRRYITANPCDQIERVCVEQHPPRILTPDEARNLMRWVRANRPDAVAWFALALFAGLRPSEADAMEWHCIDLERGIATVDAATSKVRRRRVVELQPCAVAWLRAHQDCGFPVSRWSRRNWTRAAREPVGLRQWPADLLRHTAASYLLARTQDAARVALWLGNSPAILLRHYRELVRKEDSERFFAIFPES